MIDYSPFWETMQRKSITKYQLIYHWGLSSNILRRMSHGEAISSTTLNQLCMILDCKVQDVLHFEYTPEEKQEIKEKRKKLRKKKK